MRSLNFYPRSPCGERHLRYCMPTGPRYFYPRSPCGERPLPNKIDKDTAGISIHALLAESDLPLLPPSSRPARFLSTLSLRRATGAEIHNPGQVLISIHALLAESDPSFGPLLSSICHFYPRSPCGERLRKVPILGVK